MSLIQLEDGRKFPHYRLEVLSWSIGSSFTLQDEKEGYPRTRAIIEAFRIHRPEELKQERRELIKSMLCDRLFGHNAKKLLAIVDEAYNRI